MVVYHIVAFSFKPEVTAESKKEVIAQMVQLKDKCVKEDGKPYILDMVAGKNDNPEPKNNQFEHAFIMQFKDKEDRDYYTWKESAHHDFSKYIRARGMENVLVLDIENGEF